MPKTDISVRDLVSKVEHGDLTLPEMQRKYVWTSTRVRDLLDSLYRGYPSGTILVWETDDDIDTRKLSVGTTGSSPTSSQKLLLLDGQQRITSLAAVLQGQPIVVKNRKRPIEILFNLEHPAGPPTEIYETDTADVSVDYEQFESKEEAKRDIQKELKSRTFVVSTSSLRNDPLWVSVSDIFSKSESEILKRVGINSDDDKWDMYSQRLRQVKNIENYPYVMQVLTKEMSYEEVTEIFVRVNSLGAKLRSSDLALAQITSKWRGFMDVLEDFSKEFGDDSEYIEDWVAIRLMTVFATKQSKFKAINRVKLSKLEEAWEFTKKGTHFAVNFLRHNAGIENLSHISASMLVVPIAVYAVLNNEKLTPTEEKKLLKWFYYAHMRGHYGMGSSETILNADLAVLFRGGDIDKLIEVLHEHVKRFEVNPDELSGKNSNSPFFSMLYTVFKLKGAKDWFTGLKLSDKTTGNTHSIQYHHIFPKSLLQAKGLETKEINEIANFAFIGGKTNRNITNKLPKKYLNDEVLKKNGEEPLKSQLIPLDQSLWEMESYEDFLKYRRNSIANYINEFMDSIEG